MKRNTKIVLFVLLTVLMLCMVTGCGKKKNTNVIDKNTIYKETDLGIKFPANFSAYETHILNGKVYILGTSWDEKTYETKTYVYVCNTDGTDLKTMEIPSTDTWIERITVFPSGKYALFYSVYEEDYSDPENYIYNNYYMVDLYDANGSKILTKNLTEELNLEWVNSSYNVGDTLLLLCYDRALFLDDGFKLIREVPIEEGKDFSSVYRLRDGSYVAYTWGENGDKYVRIDLNTLQFGDEISIPTGNYYYNLMQGTPQYDFLVSDSNQIYGFNIGDAELTPLMNFINSDLSIMNFSTIDGLEDGSFIGSYNDWLFDDYNYKICKYTKVDPADVIEKEVVTLGCLWMDSNLRKQIISFNKSNDKYRITIKDYSVYSNEENWSGDIEKMNSDIASGQSPDIVIASNSSVIRSYVSKGLFMDLNKFLEDDEDLKRDDFLPNILDVCSYNGKLYMLAPSFGVQTLVGKTSLLNGMTGWTIDEMKNYAASLPEGKQMFFGMTRESFLSSVLNVNSDQFIDMAAGKCYFDSPEFIGLLEYTKTLEAESDNFYNNLDYSDYETAYRDGRIILNTAYLSNLSSIQYTEKVTFGEDVTYIGYPCEDRNGASISFDMLIAISSKCASSEGAWEFVKRFFSDEYQSNGYGNSTLLAYLDKQCEEAIRPIENEYDSEMPMPGVRYAVDGPYRANLYYIGGEYVTVDPLTEADAERYKKLVMSANKIASYYADIEKIITEEVEAFYAGQKPAADVAKIIQSRVTIYINEKQ